MSSPHINPADLPIWYGHVMLTYAEETTSANDYSVKLSALINDEFGDAANLFVVVVINIEPD